MKEVGHGSTRSRTDWAEARKLHELEGWTFSAIAELMDVTVQAVSSRAQRESWFRKGEIVAEARANAVRKFIERESKAVLDTFAERHALVDRLQSLVGRHVGRLEQDVFWAKCAGYKRDGEPILHHEDPAETLRKLVQSLHLLESVDAQLLRDGPWRNGDDGKGKLPPLPADFDFLKALRKRKPQEQVQ